MSTFYTGAFILCGAACAYLKYEEQRRSKAGGDGSGANGAGADGAPAAAAAHTPEQRAFQRDYLVVFVCAFFADWLKGPYVYALYEAYGFSPNQIAMLFLVGFGVSGISGPFIGAAADIFGRRKLCVAYFATYILSALCKPINSYAMLMIGRLLGGLGTSLLYTVFESWMVAEHNRRGYPNSLLDDTFAKSTLYNGLSAVAAGLIAQAGASVMGFVGPFIVALIPLAFGLVMTLRTWRDDSADRSAVSGGGSGDESSPSKAKQGVKQSSAPSQPQASVMSTVHDAMTAMNSDLRIWCLGMSQSLFEGAMYTFVFLWSPALCEGLTKSEIAAVPYGLIFSAFMIMVMAGSSMFSILLQRHKLEVLPFVVHGASIVCCLGTVASLGWSQGVFVTFVVFEMICGIFFPVFGSLRAVYVPEKQRSTIMNFFRVPLNLFVVVVLVKKKHMTNETTFLVCAAAHLLSLGIWFGFATLNAQKAGAKGSYAPVVTAEGSAAGADLEEDFGHVEDGESV
jgi:MFS family permease